MKANAIGTGAQPAGGGACAPTCCILGASLGTGNLGVSALASSTVASILTAFPAARVFFLDYGRVPERYVVKHAGATVSIELVNLRFSWKLFLRNNVARLLLTALLLRLVPARGLRERLLARNPYLRRIQEAEIIGALAGGDSFSDIYGLTRLWYVTLPQLLVLALGKPLTLLPQTLGPFEGRLARKWAAFILRRADRVYARDEASLKVIERLLGTVRSCCRFSYDMAFFLEPVAPARRFDWLAKDRPERPRVGLNVSGLLCRGGYSGRNMFGLRTDYRQLVCDVIRYFIRQGAEVVLVPHVFAAADGEDDLTACVELARELEGECSGRLHCVSERVDQHEIKYLIGRCDFFLGSRMHACIAALSQCVPAVGLAYSSKFDGVLRSIGVESLVIDLRQLGTDAVVEQIGRAYGSRDETRAALSRKMPVVRETISRLFVEIASKTGSTDERGRMRATDPVNASAGEL